MQEISWERKKSDRNAKNFTGAKKILPERKKFDESKEFYGGARNFTKAQEIQRRTYGDVIRKNATN